MKKHVTKLIRGTFRKDKAKVLLLELLWHKINYHEKQQFSNKERFGRDDEHSEKRIHELVSEKNHLIQWLDSLAEDAELKVSCDIEMQLE
ncbi:MAG: hypothetical protein ACTHJN_02035 [Ginsengibacter sp.]